VRIEEVTWGQPDGSALRAAQRVEIEARYGRPDSEPGPAPTAEDMTVFFVAYSDDGTPMGCGGLRRLDPHFGEVKRMYVTPQSRGTGVSTAILDRLEQYAADAGWQRLVLETGDMQPDAERFYLREGYSRIPNFGYYIGSDLSRCFEKVLVPADPALDTVCEGCE
jgi:putative acetyltransferase